MENIQNLLLFEPQLILKANSSGRHLNIIILIHILLRNLNFTIEKLRKQHISSFKGK